MCKLSSTLLLDFCCQWIGRLGRMAAHELSISVKHEEIKGGRVLTINMLFGFENSSKSKRHELKRVR